jgi:uncharacterized protein YdcH (DUF465 family)
MTLAVNPAVRRQGIGTELVSQALGMGLARGTSRALLEVRQSNVSAQMLYHRFGFQPYGTRKAYYTNPNEDAILMALDPIAFPPTFTFHQRRDPMVTDEHIADHLRVANSEYREIEESHHRLDAELQELLKHHVLTPQEEILKKQIQKEKLGKKDRMAALIREYRSNQGQSAPV